MCIIPGDSFHGPSRPRERSGSVSRGKEILHHLSRLAEAFEGFRDRRGAPARYGLAVCMVGAALLLSFALYPGAAEEHPFSMFYAVVTVSALVGGFGPGLAATLLSVVVNLLFVVPAGAPGRAFPEELLHAGLFLLEGLVICLLVTSVFAARRRAQSAEEAARRTDEYYRSLFRNASDMIVLIDPAGKILYESDSVEWLLGYKPEKRVGKNVLDLIHPEDARRLGASFPGSGEPVEFRARARDGSLRHFEAVGKDMTGDPDVGAVVMDVRDVTERKRVEASLREAEVRYRAMVERMPAVTYTQRVDGDHAMTFVSPQVEEMLGYTPREYLSRPKFELSVVHPEDRERVREEDELTDATGKPFVSEYRAIARDGRVVWLHEEAVVARDEAGKPLFWQGFMLDVTARKRAEAERQENEERFRATFEQAAVGMAHVDLEGRWIRVNDRLCEVVGYTAEELLSGMNFQDLTHPEDLEADLEQNERLLRGEIETFSLEKRYVRKGGGIVWVDLTVSMARDASGVPKYVICVIEDISRRKESEWALRGSEERFRALVQNSLDFVALRDLDNTIRYVSPSVKEVLGYEPEEMLGTLVPDYIHPDDREKAERGVEMLLAEPSVRVEPIRYRKKYGDYVYLEGVFSNRISNPSVRGVVCNLRDVTENVDAEKELRRSLDLLLTLRETGQVLGATLDAGEICSRLIEAAQRVTKLAAARVEVWEDAGGPVSRFSSDPAGASDPVPESPEVEAVRREAIETRERRVLQTWRPDRPDRAGEQMTGLYLPLEGHGRVVGVLEVYGDGSLNDGKVSAILDSLANQAATALENARLYQEIGERERRLQELLVKQLGAQEEERRRVAYEVHDGLAQVAAAAHQHLQAFARRNAPEKEEVRAELDLVVKLVRRTVTDARRIIANLRPTALDDFGLSAALALEVEKLREDGYEVEYADGIGDERLPEASEITLYRIAQESIANMRKHAGTQRARVDLRRLGEEARLEVRDWGHGFEPEGVSASSGPGERVGLAGMRERAGMLGGTFEVHSSTGGTAVVATVPLKD